MELEALEVGPFGEAGRLDQARSTRYGRYLTA